MRKLLEYSTSGDWPGENMDYENSVVIRSGDQKEIVFRSVIRDENGDAVYSHSTQTEIDESMYDEWMDQIELNDTDFDEVNEDSNLGPGTEYGDLDELMPSDNRRSYSRPGANNRTSRLWIREGEASDQELDITWEGLSPHGVYQDVIGEDTVPEDDWRQASEWEKALPSGLIDGMPRRSFELYKRLGIEEVASDMGVSPVEVFQEFYDGGTDQDEYVVVSGDDGDEILANPFGEQVRDAVESTQVQSVRYLHDGNVETFLPREVDELVDEFSVGQQRGIEADSQSTDDGKTIFEVLNSETDLSSVNGALMHSEDRQDVVMRTEKKVKNPV